MNTIDSTSESFEAHWASVEQMLAGPSATVHPLPGGETR